MRPLRAETLYDLLEVSPEATGEEIARAYQIARVTYKPSSIATYPVFSDDENREILQQVEEAYLILSDEHLRREYDARLRQQQLAERPAPATETPASTPPPAPAPRPVASSEADLELEESLEPADGIYDGPVLRRIRLSRGVELEEIAGVTKISEVYLRCIEQNRFHELPAAVYVRGFLREYAKCLRLDPASVVESYMERLREDPRGRR